MSSEDPNDNERTIYINDPTPNAQQKFLHNKVSTAKYNFITFLPKYLYEQSLKYVNWFTLFISE